MDEGEREPSGPGDHSLVERPGLDRAYALAALGSSSIEGILRRDKQRAEEDGFPQKVRWVRHIYPTKGGKRVLVLPHATPDRIVHGDNLPDGAEEPLGEGGGSGDGEVGDVIGRKRKNGAGGTGAGDEEGEHAIEEDAERIGKLLTEHLRLPNLEEKGKTRSRTRFTYELTDANRGSGQRLDTQRSIEEIIRTNIAIGRITDFADIDPSNLVVGPDDLWYRTLSREPDVEPRALVFFMRDYSGSMTGMPTELVVNQHLMLYCWLMYQYKGNVQTRFIVHDSVAKEVPDFAQYHRLTARGGTDAVTGYQLIERIIDEEHLERDYNLYLFHGTDGDDALSSAQEIVMLFKTFVPRMSRVGITIVRPEGDKRSTMQVAIEATGALTQYKGKVAMSLLRDDKEESIIRSLREVLS